MSTAVQTTFTPDAVRQILLAALFQSVSARDPNEGAMYAALRDWAVRHLDRLIPPEMPGRLDGRALAADVLAQTTVDDPDLERARAAAIVWLRTPATPPPPPPPPDLAIQDDLLTGPAPWIPGSLTMLDGAWETALLAYCQAAPRTLILADMAALPDAMRAAGFRGRDNALWYTLSRSFAGWNWGGDPDDPDAHLSDQRQELRDFWAGYLEADLETLGAVAATRATFLLNDGPDRCGDVLSEYSLRDLGAVADRVDRGPVFTGVRPTGLGFGYVLGPTGRLAFWDDEAAARRVAQQQGVLA